MQFSSYFYVSPKNGNVFFYDTTNDSVIKIEDWRKSVQKKLSRKQKVYK